MKVLILVAHPKMAESKANKALIEAVQTLDGVQVVDLCAAHYTTEQYGQMLSEAETVVLQFPLYFGSAPAVLKVWIDETFSAILDQAAGKQLLVATTAGAVEETFRSGGPGGFTIDELLRPYQFMASYARMRWLTPFAVYSADEEPYQIAGAEAYRKLIASHLA